jgi:PAS domain S-box-containing protein
MSPAAPGRRFSHPSCILDGEGRFIEVSPEWTLALGWARGRLIGARLADLLEPVRDLEPSGALGHVSSPANEREVRLRCSNGASRTLLWSTRRRGTFSHVTAKDLSAVLGVEAAVALADGHVEFLSIGSGGAVCLVSADGRIVEASGQLCAVVGFALDELLGAPAPFPFWPVEAAALLERALVRARSGRRSQLEVQLERRDGERFAALIDVAANIAGHGSAASAILCLVRDVSSKAGEAEGLVRWEWDPVNDRVRTAQVEVDTRVREAEGYMRAVTGNMGEGVLTLDPAGRVLSLNAAAERMLGWDSGDFVGELASVVLEVTGGMSFATTILSGAGRRDEQSMFVDDSIFLRRNGSQFPVTYTSSLFAGHEGAQSCVVIFSDITPRKAEEERTRLELQSFKWVSEVRDALESQQFWLAAQPIVEVATRRTVRHELLLRMRDRRGRTIAPGEFLPAAEASGLVREIDRWVAREAVSLARRGHAVALNISASSLGDPDLYQVIERLLVEASVDPTLLTFEVTETAVLKNEGVAKTFIEGVAKLGCRIALDDFGTGYGGFSYLKHLPVNYLKIDREFVRDLSESSASRHVVEAIVSLARDFGQQTIAEGVERGSTILLLAGLGVDHVQGFAVGRPAPAGKVFAVPEAVASR